MRALYNTIHWSFSSCNLSRSHSFPLGLYQPTCDPRSKSRPRNWKQTHERTRSPRYLDVTQRFFISIPKTWSSDVFILQSFSNLSTSHYILKETLCLNVVSNYCFYKFHYRRLKDEWLCTLWKTRFLKFRAQFFGRDSSKHWSEAPEDITLVFSATKSYNVTKHLHP